MVLTDFPNLIITTFNHSVRCCMYLNVTGFYAECNKNVDRNNQGGDSPTTVPFFLLYGICKVWCLCSQEIVLLINFFSFCDGLEVKNAPPFVQKLALLKVK